MIFASKTFRIIVVVLSWISPVGNTDLASAVRSRNPFIPAEDQRLVELVARYPFQPWGVIAAQMPGRTARQCRERYQNYLNPEVISRPWTEAEDIQLIQAVQDIGRYWSVISLRFENRSDNDVKNRWHSHLKYKVQGMPPKQKRHRVPPVSRALIFQYHAQAAVKAQIPGGSQGLVETFSIFDIASQGNQWIDGPADEGGQQPSDMPDLGLRPMSPVTDSDSESFGISLSAGTGGNHDERGVYPEADRLLRLLSDF
jgi:hypothetical protein